MKRFPLVPSGLLLCIAPALSIPVALAQGDVTVTENSVGGSGVTATATLTAVGNQTSITVSARGLTPGTENMNQVNFGTCANTGGDAFILSNLMAAADGTATATTTINATLASLQDGNHLLHIHRGAGAQEGAIVACGDIPVAAAAAAATPAAAATATPAVAATATPAATVTVTASPTALPKAGGPVVPLIPAAALGAAALGLGMLFRRR